MVLKSIYRSCSDEHVAGFRKNRYGRSIAIQHTALRSSSWIGEFGPVKTLRDVGGGRIAKLSGAVTVRKSKQRVPTAEQVGKMNIVACAPCARESRVKAFAVVTNLARVGNELRCFAEMGCRQLACVERYSRHRGNTGSVTGPTSKW